MPTVLYNGTTGQVGRAIQELSSDHPFDWIGISSADCNLTDAKAIKAVFENHNADYFIQVAAYTTVDKAEEEQELAYAINSESTKQIAQLCKENGMTMLYVSSDYVYHSIVDQPIKETDPCTPKGIYAKSKFQGEENVRATLPEHIIMRTSWVYDREGHNFVNSMIRLGQARESLTIVADQYGAPTYAPDIAEALITMVTQVDASTEKSKLYGTYNFTNGGVTHWAGFAEEIFNIKEIECTVSEITTEQFGAPAPRPAWSVLSTEKYRTTFNKTVRSWQECLRDCLSS
jgi:dTDP-4-dehydrorhamnose reductase